MQSPSGQVHGDDLANSRAGWPMEDRGSFTHGVCRSCGWVGPGRRSRKTATSDSELHVLAGCDVPAPDGTAALTGSEGSRTDAQDANVASGRERLTARGRS